MTTWPKSRNKIRETHQGETTLYQLNGNLYTFTNLEENFLPSDFWHYGVNWYGSDMGRL